MDINIDLRAVDHQIMAEADPAAAAQLLLLVAEYLRKREAVPDNIADYIARAIEEAMRAPVKERSKALGDNLHLSTNNRRPAKVSYIDVGEAFDSLLEKGESKNVAKMETSILFKISESTAERRWRKYREELKQSRED